MKILTSSSKRRFWTALAVIFVFTIIVLYEFQTFQKNRIQPVLRVAYSYNPNGFALDPKNLDTNIQYELSDNIYARLVRYDEVGQLTSDLPVSVKTQDRKIIFEFADRAKTESGRPIGANDAAISLKRLILDGDLSHSALKTFLCPKASIQSLSDPCSGIEVQGQKLVLSVDRAELVPLFLTFLDSPEYSILPVEDFDPSNGKFVGMDHLQTSGPYRILFNSQVGEWELKADPSQFRYSPEMPLRISLLSMKSSVAVPAFEEDKVDVLPSTTYFGSPQAYSILKNPRYSIYESIPIRVSVVNFSNDAIKTFSVEQRFYAGLLALQAGQKVFGIAGGRPTQQFFQASSSGALDEDKLSLVDSARSVTREAAGPFPRPITLGVYKAYFAGVTEALKNIPEVKVILADSSPLDVAPEKRPDMFYVVQDSSWAEDISVVSYNLNNGFFSAPGLHAREWIETYLGRKNKADRLTDLKDLHFKVLMSGSVIPSEVAPYFAAARNGWKFHQNKLISGTDLWAMRRH